MVVMKGSSADGQGQAGGAAAMEVAPRLAEAMALARRGAWTRALERLEELIAAAPGAPEPLVAKARLLRARGGEHTAALRALRRALSCASAPRRRAEILREYGALLEPIGRHREAAAAFEEAIELLECAGRQPVAGGAETTELETLYDLASRAHERAGHYERALVRHRGAIGLYREVRGDLGAYYAREAELLERLGRYAELCVCYERLVHIDPDRVLFAQPAGRPGLETATRIKNLLAGVNQVLSRQPGALVPRVLKAGLFYRLGRYRNARALLRRAIERGPEHWFAWHLLGKVELKMGRLEAAREALVRARAGGPVYLDLLRDMALVAELSGQLEEAQRLYREIETRWPGRHELLRRAAQVRERLGRLEDAYETYRLLAVQLLEVDPELLERLAQLALRLGRTDAAERHIEECLEAIGDPHSEQALRMRLRRAELRAARSAEQGRMEALEEVRAVLALLRGLPPGVARRLRLEAASCLLEPLGCIEEALEVIDALLQDGPDDLDALVLRGDALFKAKRFEDAVACYTHVADRRLADALIEQGQRLFEEKRFDKAIGKWNEAFSKDPRAWEIHYCAAAAYARLGQPEAAVRYLEAAARQNPGALVLMHHDANFDAVWDSEPFVRLRGGGNA